MQKQLTNQKTSGQYLSSNFSRSDYETLVTNKNRKMIANFFKERFTERYITPIKSTPPTLKHGFTTIAVSCLLIETLESFWNGWENTKHKSNEAFCKFFNRSSRFKIFLNYEDEFYTHVRCGVLHQAETSGGWTIRRHGPLFDPPKKAINATSFHKKLKEEIVDYANILRSDSWESERWRLFRKKMKAICKNCDT